MKKLLIGIFGLVTQATFAQQDQLDLSEGTNPPKPHNHWGKGIDNAWGVAGADDDGDTIVDNAKPAPPFEPGMGPKDSDKKLEHESIDDWPKGWALPNPLHGLSPIEAEAINETDNNYAEHQLARQDWGDRGKNHRTTNEWND